MNSCDYYQELISRLVDGELSRDEHEALMEHMKNCSACNAMYAVFHDLSDILAEESEPLPEGLHENIMAGVRRSAIIRKNRRMSRFGLRTAMTAAACAVLVLFAAVGVGPGERAESVSIRSEEAVPQSAPSQTPVFEPAPDQTPEFALVIAQESPREPSATAAPAYVPTPVPLETRAPADVYAAAGGNTNTQYSVPEQSYTYQQPDAQVWTKEPAPDWSAPAPTAEPAPAMIAPQAPVQIEEPGYALNTAAAPARNEAPAMTSFSTPAAEEMPAAEEEAAAEEVEIGLFSLFGSMDARFESAPEEATPGTQDGDFAAAAQEPAEAGSGAPDTAELPEMPAVRESLDMIDTAGKKPSEENISVYGKARRAQLLAMLGENEEALPEAELTRLVHVTLMPEDEYGSEERLDIRIYGDFIFWQSLPQTGTGKSCRADCALRDLDSFLLSCRLVSPSPAPTVDPFSAAQEKLPE